MLFAVLACVGATISTPPIAWTIAGSDAGGGAGIQADLAAFRALGVHGCSAITALTAQNSVEVRMVEYPSIEMLRTTLAALRDDLPAGAIKIGMTGREWVIREVADFLTSYKGPVVCDPVMVSTSGRRLLDADASAALISKLFPRCALITPNLPEAEALLGRKLRTPAEVEEAAAALLGMGCGAVLIKGGHMHEAEVCSSGTGLGDRGGEGGSGGEGSGGEGSAAAVLRVFGSPPKPRANPRARGPASGCIGAEKPDARAAPLGADSGDVVSSLAAELERIDL